MRSTKASAAVSRLRLRSGNASYSMSCRSDGQFALLVASESGRDEHVGTPLPLDEFVRFVNGIEASQPKPLGKLDAAFLKQLKK